MRQVLVDHARARATEKRGKGKREAFDENKSSAGIQVTVSRAEPIDILELNRAIDALSFEDTNLAELVELRYFGGMTAEETAVALGRSVHVVRHDLRLAHAWLRRQLGQKER
jgi:RNA polymerase sigma factor (TIGR02999 family)